MAQTVTFENKKFLLPTNVPFIEGTCAGHKHYYALFRLSYCMQ